MSPSRIANALFALLALLGAAGVMAAEPERKALRVCADPNNPPLSDRASGGYENRIAELIGKDLGLPVEYTWSPQRMGFIRNTLRAADGKGGFRCDLVIGVPSDYELTATTRPYLHSSWVMVFAPRPEFADIKTPEDFLKLPQAVRDTLRFGAFTRTPPMEWLFQHDLFERAVAYRALSADPEEFPGQMVAADLAAGKIDVAMVWGPIGGYYAHQSKEPLRVLPFVSTPQLKFDYLLSMGVRHPDKAWRDTVDGVIARRQADIDKILRDYGVPLLELPAPKAAEAPGGGRS
jgi:quinoprotein dehydrogenase-associated probable ABC transporter substrate-binding protein